MHPARGGTTEAAAEAASCLPPAAAAHGPLFTARRPLQARSLLSSCPCSQGTPRHGAGELAASVFIMLPRPHNRAPPPLQAQARSFADLPPDVLHLIFSMVLPSSQPLPLLDAAQQWLALQLTCKAWAAVLQHVTVAVEACLPHAGSLRWLQEHAAVLHLLPPNGDRYYNQPKGSADAYGMYGMDDWMLDWIRRRCGPPGDGTVWRRDPDSGMAAFVSCIFGYADFMPLLMEGRTQMRPRSSGLGTAPNTPLLALAACSQLKVRRLCHCRALPGLPAGVLVPLCCAPSTPPACMTGAAHRSQCEWCRRLHDAL